jgi:hypothetical protein
MSLYSFDQVKVDYPTMKRLYLIDLEIMSSTLFSLPTTKTLFHVHLMIYANASWEKVGKWSVTTLGASIFGVSEGYWKYDLNYKREPSIWFYEVEPPHGITHLWRDNPAINGWIDIPKFPIPLGSTGEGYINQHKLPFRKGKKSYAFQWRVMEAEY